MTKPKFFTTKFLENLIRFGVYALALMLTPLIAKPFAPLFDWVGYSLMRPMFEEIFTMIFWAVEGIVIWLVERKIAKKRAANEAPAADGTEETVEQKRPPMPLKNFFLLTGICIVCVFVVSAIIGFKVKPFYDIGEKVTGHELFSSIMVIVRNIAKCIWLVAMLDVCKKMADEVMKTSLNGAKPYLVWALVMIPMFSFGIFDVFTSVVSYPMGWREWLIAGTYLLFYPLFAIVYALAEESKVKSYFLIMFIYLF